VNWSLQVVSYAGAVLVFFAYALMMALLSSAGWSKWLLWAMTGAVAVAIVWVVDRLGTAATRRRMQARPRITADEVETLVAAMATDTHDALRLTLTEGPTAPAASRIGGAPWSPDPQAAWPVGPDGRPLVFLGQVNFADLSALPDFPEHGLLQIFVGGEQAAHLVWHDAPAGGGVLTIPEMFLGKAGRAWHPFRGSAQTRGLAIAGAEAQTVPANDHLHPHAERADSWSERLPADPEVEALLRDHAARMETLRASYGTHWIGGHPSFVQYDPRAELDDYHDRGLDCVILHLGWEPGLIESGDSGEINILIATADLRARRWDRAVWYEDCS